MRAGAACALVGGDTEKVALQWANEQVWAGCTGQIAGQERSRFPQYWPLPASPRRRAVNQKRREFVAGSYGSSGRTRTYNPSVNSRMPYSRLALQTKILRRAKTGFRGNLGGLWGYSCRP